MKRIARKRRKLGIEMAEVLSDQPLTEQLVISALLTKSYLSVISDASSKRAGARVRKLISQWIGDGK